jgi:hypothetical protein
MPDCRTVGELIKALQEYPENMPVVVLSGDYQCSAQVEISHEWTGGSLPGADFVLVCGAVEVNAFGFYDRTTTYTLKEKENE